MTQTPTKSVFENIDAQILLLKDEEEELAFVLESAKQRLIDFLERGEYQSDKHGQNIVAFAENDERLAESFAMSVDTFPFLSNFSLAEYLSFSDSHREFLDRQMPKKKRGRPRKNEDDRAKERQKWLAQILSVFKGLRQNMMTGCYEYLQIDPKTGKFSFYSCGGNDLELLSTKMSLEHGIVIPADECSKLFRFHAQQNKYYPQVEMLNQARKMFPDMSVKEAQTILMHMGTKMWGVNTADPLLDDRTLRDVAFERFFRGMAHLARNPGNIPFWMPVLIGSGGTGKSAFVNHMIPRGEFETLSTEVTVSVNKLNDEAYRLHVAFLLEFPEIDAQMNSKNTEYLKNLVTVSTDNIRRPYQALPERLTRQFGLIGTTNRDELFVEAADGERRFIPIQIPPGHEIPWTELRDTDLAWKIWAAADILAQQCRGDERELRAWTKEEQRIIGVFQGNYTQTDLWEAKVLNYIALSKGRKFATSQLLDSIGVDVTRMSTTSTNRRINEIILKHFGERAKKVQITLSDKSKTRGWEIEPKLNDPLVPLTTDVKDLGDVALNDPLADF